MKFNFFRRKDNSKRGAMTFRFALLTVFFLAVAARIGYFTFRNTVIDRDEWNKKANIELSRTLKKIQPDRGDILSSDGSVLATTLQYYDILIDFGSEAFKWKDYVSKKDSLADSLQHYFPIKGGVDAWRDSLDAPIKREKRPRGWRLITGLTYPQSEQIRHTFPFFAEFNDNSCGFVRKSRKRRRNPFGSMAKLSIGVVTEGKDTTVHGMSGLEWALDSLLYGKPGVSKKVNFTRGIGNWAEVPAVRGWDVTSSIDVQMQDLLETALLNRLEATNAEWGTAVLMEVATGEIKAISNLEEDIKRPGSGVYVEAMNRAVRGFEPGSVVKTLSLMIAIDDGYVTRLDSTLQIGARYQCFGMGRAITDSHVNSTLTVEGVIEQSSNIGMAKIMSRFYKSPQGWHDRVAKLGFLEKLKSGIGEEKPARYPVYSIEAGGMVALSRQFYGYGCEIPPLHTLSIYNAIANGGKYVRPRLVKKLHREGIDSVVPVSYVRDRACSERTARMMQQCLWKVVNGKHGTGRSLKNPYVTLAGKTGTCYVVDPKAQTYDNSRKRLAFCGYFPAENPKYSCMVLIYHPRKEAFGAASTSGVVLRDVAISMYARGMLGNSSDYRNDSIPHGKEKTPVVYASASNRLEKAVRRAGRTESTRRLSGGDMPAGGLPNVRGMGLREAVSLIEKAGYDVAFSGTGYVRSQLPAPGTRPKRGQKVQLVLKP